MTAGSDAERISVELLKKYEAEIVPNYEIVATIDAENTKGVLSQPLPPRKPAGELLGLFHTKTSSLSRALYYNSEIGYEAAMQQYPIVQTVDRMEIERIARKFFFTLSGFDNVMMDIRARERGENESVILPLKAEVEQDYMAFYNLIEPRSDVGRYVRWLFRKTFETLELDTTKVPVIAGDTDFSVTTPLCVPVSFVAKAGRSYRPVARIE